MISFLYINHESTRGLQVKSELSFYKVNPPSVLDI